MVNIHSKKILILGLFSVFLTVHAADTDRALLVQQCQHLSESIFSLVTNQGKKFCIEKLDAASFQINTAGKQILLNNYALAKQELETAILSLHYAELNACNRYIQISHSKFQAQKIRGLL